MSGVEMQDSWSIAPPIETDSSHNQVTMKAWAEEYGLIPRLVPFEQRADDPIAVLDTIRRHLDGMPATAATTRLSYIQDELPFRGARVPNVEPLLEMLGSWNSRVNANSNLERRWVNPNYAHLKNFEPNVTDPDERRQIIERLASYGVLTIADIAPRFGISRDSLQRWLSRYDIQWSEIRRDGIRRLARTCATIHEWTGWSYSQMATVLGVNPKTLWDWVDRYARQTAFGVPEDPSGEPWFTRKSFTSEGSR